MKQTFFVTEQDEKRKFLDGVVNSSFDKTSYVRK